MTGQRHADIGQLLGGLDLLADPRDRVQNAEREPVQAVVLDYSMPGMSGAEVATRMRSTKPEIPILLLSAYVDLPSDVRGVVDVYMTKGEGAPALLQKLKDLF